MGEIKHSNETWREIGPELNIVQLEDLEGDRVNINCLNSSEFVVGKQTNFNGPVTIINCANGETLKLGSPENEDKDKKENIVIRDKVLSKSAAEKVKMAAAENGPKEAKQRWRVHLRSWLLDHMIAIPVAVFVGLAVAVAITLAVLYVDPGMVDIEDTSECVWIEKLGRKSCIHLVYDWNVSDTKNFSEITTPVPYVVVSETHEKECFSPEACLEAVEAFQKKVRCNFLVGGTGGIYEDLGWDLTNSLGGPAHGRNLLVCLVGNFFDGEYPTYPQVETTKALIAYGVERDFVARDYVLVGADAACVGDYLSGVGEVIKKWPTFSEAPFSECALASSASLNDSDAIPLHIFSKADWGGGPPENVIEMQLPVPYVVVSHTVTATCSNLETCAPSIRIMQSYHFSRDFADIAYNFLVDSAGRAYEGRGWKARSSITGFASSRNINVAFMGDFSNKLSPTEEQFRGLRALLDFGVATGKLTKDYSLIAHNATVATLSPGRKVYEVIKNWPHFDPDPKSHVRKYENR